VNSEALSVEIERMFIFALTWTIGGTLEHEDRMKFTDYLHNISANPFQNSNPSGKNTSNNSSTMGIVSNFATPHITPHAGAMGAMSASDMLTNVFPLFTEMNDTLFDYRVNTDSMEWERWSVPSWDYPHHIAEPDFSSLLVPTVQTTRTQYIMHHFHQKNRNILLTGE
jgi:dynein heavy chain